MMKSVVTWNKTSDKKPKPQQGFEACGMQLLAVWDGEVMVAKYNATSDTWHYVDWEDAIEPEWWAEYPLPPKKAKNRLSYP